MYLNILKKDLKRKRAMNVILLVFIILASMFVSSSANNILNVTTALDNYFDMADAPDYLVMTSDKSLETDVEEIIKSAPSVDRYGNEKALSIYPDNLIFEDEDMTATNGSITLLQSDRDMAMNYFLSDGSILEAVKRGEVYVTSGRAEDIGLKAGDKITIEIESISREFTFAGTVKDAALGSKMDSMCRYIISGKDFEDFISDETVKNFYGGDLYYIHTNDLQQTISEISEASESFAFVCDKAMLKLTYCLDMIVTGFILVISLVLIAIAFVVLRFTITFTLSEEFREIGVMKAIGIGNSKIRGLYLVKYAALSVIGAVIGLVLSFPFGEMLMSVSSISIIINDQNPFFVNIICAALVIAVILLFCFGCTGKVKKMTPIDAIRNGQTGERFRKKSIMSLGKSRLPGAAFLALNDIVSSPKRYGIIALTFFLCMSLLIILSNGAASLKSGKLMKYFGLTDCHIIASTGDDAVEFMTEDGHEKLEKYLEDMEQSLAENGMPAECMEEMYFYPNIKYGEYECKVLSVQGTGTTMDMYEYTEGTPPQNSDEIALSALAAKTLKANIGDTVAVSYPEGEREYIVTALFQSMNHQGTSARIYTEDDINYNLMSLGAGVQIKFTDDPDDEEISRRIERIGELYPKLSNVKTAGEWVRETTGVADAIDAGKKMFALLTVILAALIAVLMERSFIAKEKAEIALMKAIGIKNSKIYAHHTARFFIVTAIAVIAAELLGMPLTRLCFDPIFGMMGLEMGVEYLQKPVEIYAIFPAVILAATAASAFLTSLYTRKIKSSDTANIE